MININLNINNVLKFTVSDYCKMFYEKIKILFQFYFFNIHV